MITEILVTGLVSIPIGATIGYILFKKTTLFDFMKERSINKVIKNPEVLKKKLEESGELFDNGKKLNYNIITNEDGKEILEVKTEIAKEKIELTKKAPVKAKKKK